jgi:hypothetical protein
MNIHPSKLQALVEDRNHTIALQSRQARGSQAVKVAVDGRNGWLSLARLRALFGFGARADRSASRSGSVQPSKPQEQCC